MADEGRREQAQWVMEEEGESAVHCEKKGGATGKVIDGAAGVHR